MDKQVAGRKSDLAYIISNTACASKITCNVEKSTRKFFLFGKITLSSCFAAIYCGITRLLRLTLNRVFNVLPSDGCSSSMPSDVALFLS
jgi:hypothetical protein